MSAPFRVESLARAHDRTAFSCGEPALDRYFQMQAGQDVQRRLANCFVAVDAASGDVVGFYTIAAAGIPFRDLPLDQTRRLPRYPMLPAALIGRLAVAIRYRGRGRGLGGALLADAARRLMQAPPAVYVLLVDAKTEAAAEFYRHHGFAALESRTRTLFLPMATAEKTLLPAP